MRGALSILGRESECFSIAALCFLSMSMSMRMNVVPLQPVNERLRLLGGSAKVALDLLEYDSKLERAFITICGYATMPALCMALTQPFQHTRDDLFLAQESSCNCLIDIPELDFWLDVGLSAGAQEHAGL